MPREIVSRFAVELDLGYRDPQKHVYGLLNPIIDLTTRDQLEHHVWARELWGIITEKWGLGLELHEDPGIRNAARVWFDYHVHQFLAEMHEKLKQNPQFVHIRGRDLILWIFEQGNVEPRNYRDTIMMPSFSLTHNANGYTRVPLSQEELKISGQYLSVKNLLQAIILEHNGGRPFPPDKAQRFSDSLEQRLIFDPTQKFAEVENPSRIVGELSR
ncbi:MAG: hypothetical protein ABIB47_02670 [Candidatus Woesearchaeota archaeon]